MGLTAIAVQVPPVKQLILVHGAENFVGQRVSAALAASEWAAPLPVETGDLAAMTRALGTFGAGVRCISGNAAMVRLGAAEFYGALRNEPLKPRMVHLSSMTVYGTAVGAVREESDLLADLGPYSRAHREAERAARCYENTVILRPGGEYGPDCAHWTLHIARLLLAGRLGDLGANGAGRCNLLYIDDLVEAIVRALRLPNIGGQIYNLGVTEPSTWNEYFADFSRTLGAAALRQISAHRLTIETRVLAPAFKGAELLLKSARLSARAVPLPITPRMLALWRHPIQLDVSRAEESLGLRWTDRSRGLERAAAWCRESLGLHA